MVSAKTARSTVNLALFAIAIGGIFASAAAGCSTTTNIYAYDSDAGHAGKSDAGSAYGASCDAYYGSGGCCVSIANGISSAVDACNEAKTAMDQGIAAGESSSTFESACKQALDAAQSAGECTADAGASSGSGSGDGSGSSGGSGAGGSGGTGGTGTGGTGSSGGSAASCPGAAPTEADLATSVGWKAPAAAQTTACSSTDLDTLLTNFESTTITGYSQLETGLSASCTACVFTPDNAANWGVVVLDHTNTANGFINYGACYANKVSAACGQAFQYFEVCVSDSCNACATADAYDTCVNAQATEVGCESFATTEQSACGAGTSTGTPSIDTICENPIYAAAALCGGNAPDAG